MPARIAAWSRSRIRVAFGWPGHWIGIVDPLDAQGEPVGVLLFGTPSAVIASPDAPELLGRGVEELNFCQALIVVPFDPFTPPARDADRSVGELIGIYVTPVKTAPMQSVVAATAIPRKGLEGDRYAARAGTFTPRSDRLNGYDITLIESELLNRFTLPDGTRLAPEESRRNLLTKGIDLKCPGWTGVPYRARPRLRTAPLRAVRAHSATYPSRRRSGTSASGWPAGRPSERGRDPCRRQDRGREVAWNPRQQLVDRSIPSGRGEPNTSRDVRTPRAKTVMSSRGRQDLLS